MARRLTAALFTIPGALGAFTVHLFDHCPYCNRVEFLMGKLQLPYSRVVYGYGQGADPDKCGGTGYDPTGGPVALTGMKMLPVLEGEGVPTQGDMKGMPESMEICSFIASHAAKTMGKYVAPATGRGDLGDWLDRSKAAFTDLTRPRIIKMPVQDWADERDSQYARVRAGRREHGRSPRA